MIFRHDIANTYFDEIKKIVDDRYNIEIIQHIFEDHIIISCDKNKPFCKLFVSESGITVLWVPLHKAALSVYSDYTNNETYDYSFRQVSINKIIHVIEDIINSHRH